MSKLNLNAKLLYKDCGYDHHKEQVAPYDLGTVFEVEDVSMGQSSTRIKMVGAGWFNSVHFEFFNDDGCEVNIYKDCRFNPYISMGCCS